MGCAHLGSGTNFVGNDGPTEDSVAYLVSSIGVWLMVAAALGLHWQPPADHTLTLLHQAADALGGKATLRSLKAIR